MGLDTLDKVMLGGLGAFVLLMSLFAGRALSVDAQCLERGYPNHSVDWRLRGYCHGRVNASDVVVPLEKAQAP